MLNIVIRHEPTFRFPSSLGSFYTSAQKVSLSGGIEMWRAYFQSVRATPGRSVPLPSLFPRRDRGSEA